MVMSLLLYFVTVKVRLGIFLWNPPENIFPCKYISYSVEYYFLNSRSLYSYIYYISKLSNCRYEPSINDYERLKEITATIRGRWWNIVRMSVKYIFCGHMALSSSVDEDDDRQTDNDKATLWGALSVSLDLSQGEA